MHIIMFLLKILGILLLCLIVLVLIILFHPIFYKISGKIEEKAIIQGKIWWLFKIIGVDVFVNGTSYSYSIKLFGKRILSDEKTEPENAEEEMQKDAEEQKVVENENVNDVVNQSVKQPTEMIGDVGKDSPSNPENASKDTIKDKVDNAKSTIVKIKEKIASIITVLTNIRTEFKDEMNRQATLHVWNEVLYILSKLKPKYVKAELQYGTEDPALTGQITGMLSLLPLIYKYDAHIYPDFLADKMYIQGDFSMKGHVFLGHALLVVIRLFKDRNIRRMIYRIKKLGGNS